ncbi:MAG: endolytic transglycosylase MltG, partial [Sphingobacteriales bacterium]
ISSVYLNRLNRNMPLGADPTIKYALRDFKIKRLTFAHIRNSSSSPYNTYTNKGLPPGPICTPSSKSIDGVLNSKSTDYIFFCAKADFSGYHSFATNETDHFKNARAYQKALDSLRIH